MSAILKAFIEDNALIKLVDGQWFGASAKSDSLMEHDAQSISFSTEAFSDLDTRLAYVLPELSAISARKGGIWDTSRAGCDAIVATTLIRATLDYWNGLTFTLDPALGDVPIRGVGHIDSKLLVNNGPTISINLHEYWLGQCTSPDGAPISFVAKHNFKRYEVERRWLEECFPKWEERYRIADSLSYADSSLLDYVFPLKEAPVPTSTPASALPGAVLFDC